MQKFSGYTRRVKHVRSVLFRATAFRNRPEENSDARGFYESGEGDLHGQKNAIRNIQAKITLRALEILAISPPAKLLDAGCGSGFSSVVAKDVGFEVSGFDLDKKMVGAAKANGICAKLGNLTKIPFDDKFFDAAISISALQWLAAGKDTKAASEEYFKAAKEFARVLKPASRAVIQFYPKDEDEAFRAGRAFRKAGFAVTLQIDCADNPKKRKTYLVLRL
ncbi:MAG: methyltransferase domain-containing protein [Candidatus Micrarchaeia archaeon]|jgi:18S rRNA (guanine1575-N7)-methyltransferase